MSPVPCWPALPWLPAFLATSISRSKPSWRSEADRFQLEQRSCLKHIASRQFRTKLALLQGKGVQGRSIFVTSPCNTESQPRNLRANGRLQVLLNSYLQPLAT